MRQSVANSGDEYLFTVFTPTFNRIATLPRVYRCLTAQSLGDFEWLIVDDGSTDGTEDLVRSWQAEADFPIRYHWQENRGKHTAFNRGVREARGRLFLTWDSDDEAVPEALERFKHHWESIPESERHRYSAVTGLCQDPDGNIVGRRFPDDPTDSNSLEIFHRFKVYGEKWGFQRTDVLRDHPFPEPDGVTYVTENTVWTKIARRYTTRYVNEALRIYHPTPVNISDASPAKYAPGMRIACATPLNDQLDWFFHNPIHFLRCGALHTRFSLHAGIPFKQRLAEIHTLTGRSLLILLLPVGWALYRRDRQRDHAAQA